MAAPPSGAAATLAPMGKEASEATTANGPSMQRLARLPLLALLALLAVTPPAVQAREGTQTVTYDHAGTLYISPSGQGAYRQIATQSPATFTVPEGEYDLLVEGPADFFHLWHGEQTKVFIPNTSASISIPMRRETAWSRLILVVLAGVLAVATFFARRLRRARQERRTLEEALAEEKAHSELRPGAIPKKIGRYQIHERLGTGGMATVYKATDEYGDVYAIKVPDVRVLDSETSAARFFREMEISGALHHPGIVRIFEVNHGDDSTHPYIALEYLDGETLRAVLDREAPFDEKRAVKVIRDLTDALAYAHERQIIHRDLKPANIMFTRRGELRIMDFGIAKAANLDTLTGTDITLGTPDYMAPEQVDSKAASAQSDLYALGVMLYEMLTGRLPIEDTDAYRLLVRKMREPAPRVMLSRPEVTKRLDNLVALLLSADPSKRPASARDLARMLDLIYR